MRNNQTISAIVPIFNEEENLEGVVARLLSFESIDEVICINDGSTDKSLKILGRFLGRIKLIDYSKNYGKGFALASGIKEALGEIVLFIDSDLKNLSPEHISRLIAPLKDGSCKAVIGVSSFEKANCYIPLRFNIAGQRAYYRNSLLEHLPKMRSSRYGVEILLNSFFSKKDTGLTILNGLYNPPKYKKRGIEEGIKEYIKESIEIAIEVAKIEGGSLEDYLKIKQLVRLKNVDDIRQRVKNIGNQHVKSFLTQYFRRYMQGVQRILAKL